MTRVPTLALTREHGQTLVHEVVAMTLIVFAVLGALSLLGRLP